MMAKHDRQKIVCIIQARMGSSRLSGKVLKEICDKPMLAWVVDRAERSQRVDQVLVATTTSVDDDPVEKFCETRGTQCFRGSEFDVLDRYYQAAKSVNADVVIRLTADCPLMDPDLIDQVVDSLLAERADFAANRLPPPYKRTFPIGLDVEAATFAALETAWQQAQRDYEREHVMPFLYDPANSFHVIVLDHDEDLGALRWTVDTPQDLEFIRQVARGLECRDDFSWLDVLCLVQSKPDLARINADIRHKSMNDVDERAHQNGDGTWLKND